MILKNKTLSLLIKILLCIPIIVFTGCEKSAKKSEITSEENPTHDNLKTLTFTTPSDAQSVQPLIEKIRQAYKKTGYKIKILKVSADRSLKESIENESIDGELMRSNLVEDQLKGLIRVPVPLMNLSCVPFAKDENIKINSLDDLKKYSFVTIAGYLAIENFIAGIKHQTVIKGEQAIKMVREGRVQVAFILNTIAQKAIQKNKYENIRTVGPALIKSQLFHYINEKHKAILPDLTKAMSEEFKVALNE